MRCIHSTPCCRTYDPTPDAASEPADHTLYEGTGIGALYGLTGEEGRLWTLAGWSLGRGGL